MEYWRFQLAYLSRINNKRASIFLYIDRCKTNQRTNYIYIYIFRMLSSKIFLDSIPFNSMRSHSYVVAILESRRGSLFHIFFFFFLFFLARSIGPSSGDDPCNVPRTLFLPFLSTRSRWASKAHCPNPRHQQRSRAALLGATCHHNRTDRLQVVDRACGCDNFSSETCSFFRKWRERLSTVGGRGIIKIITKEVYVKL